MQYPWKSLIIIFKISIADKLPVCSGSIAEEKLPMMHFTAFQTANMKMQVYFVNPNRIMGGGRI